MIVQREMTFDSGHRVMNEKFKCFNIHGHTYHLTVYFYCKELEEIGYTIDFKEIKRLGFSFIDKYFDHGMVLNPTDVELINVSKKLNSKFWLMSLNGHEYCNPTAENISKELFLIFDYLFRNVSGLSINKIGLMETQNCGVTCNIHSILSIEEQNFFTKREAQLEEHLSNLGTIQYDDRN